MQFLATASFFLIAVSAIAIPPPASSSTPAPDPVAIAKEVADFDFTPMAQAIYEANEVAIAEAKARRNGTSPITTSAPKEEEEVTFDFDDEEEDEISENQARDLSKRGCFGLKPTSKVGKICVDACVATCTIASVGLASTLCAQACSIQL